MIITQPPGAAPSASARASISRTGDPLVSLQGLTKHFGAVRAVEALDLEIHAGETVALLGPNGAGKTTTISMLLGLLAPDRGSARVLGMAPAAAIQSGRVGAMLQEGSLMPGVRVAELLDFVLGLHASPLSRQKLLETAQLTGLERRRIDRLSGGQTQRVRFALAIASNPEILVLDEPTAGMDVEARRDFWASMHAYASSGRTVLFATHYLEEAEAFASRVVIIARGRIVADGTVAELTRQIGIQAVSFRTGARPNPYAPSLAEGRGKGTPDGEMDRPHSPVPLSHGARGNLEALAGVRQVQTLFDRVTLKTSDSDATVRALVAAGIPWSDLEVRSASLEDVFLTLVGIGGTR
jgi:ABC-2 type transport system ATP-binding protein